MNREYYMIVREYGIRNFSLSVEKIFLTFAGLTHEIFFKTPGEISYLQEVM